MFNSLAEFLQEKGHPQVYLNFYCQVKPLHTHKKKSHNGNADRSLTIVAVAVSAIIKILHVINNPLFA